MRGRVFALAALLLAACGGGTRAPAAPVEGEIGRRVGGAEPRAMVASPDGAWLAWLDGCRLARGQYLPPGTANCDLRLAPAAGGDTKRIAGAVTTLPHGLAWSPKGEALAVLAEYDYAAGAGTLVLWRGGVTTELAKEVTFHGFGPNGELGFVAGGRLSILQPGAPAPRAVAGTEDVASFELSSRDGPCGPGAGGGARLLARRTRAAGGSLLVDDCRLEGARPLLQRVGDYGFSPDGTVFACTVEEKDGAALRLHAASVGAAGAAAGRQVQRFAFEPGGHLLAFLGDASPGKQGSLYLAEPGRAAVRVAKEVGDFRWAAKAPRLAWLEKFDPRVRSGVLGAGGAGGASRTFGKDVTDFDLTADGRFVAFLQHTTRGGYSVDLGLAAVDGKEPAATVAQGVFGFAFSPDAKWLYYRTRCVRNGEGCDLERVPAAGLPKDGKPEPVAQGMKSFEFDPRDPGRLLIGWQRTDRPALDVGVWKGGRLVRVDRMVLPGSARFLGPDSRRLGYAVIDPKRPGVYVADLD